MAISNAPEPTSYAGKLYRVITKMRGNAYELVDANGKHLNYFDDMGNIMSFNGLKVMPKPEDITERQYMTDIDLHDLSYKAWIENAITRDKTVRPFEFTPEGNNR